jgi:hypothetical protein
MHSELIFSDKLWPEVRLRDLAEAVADCGLVVATSGKIAAAVDRELGGGGLGVGAVHVADCQHIAPIGCILGVAGALPAGADQRDARAVIRAGTPGGSGLGGGEAFLDKPGG